MLKLLLFRHAHADRPADVGDHGRPLSERGQEQARRMGTHIRAQGLVPDIAIVSTALRTQETWDIAAESGGFTVSKVNEPGIYEAGAGDVLEVVRRQDSMHERLMLVGHNPGMERLAAWLVGSGDQDALARLQREFAVGGLAVIRFTTQSWADLDVQSGTLERFDTPESI